MRIRICPWICSLIALAAVASFDFRTISAQSNPAESDYYELITINTSQGASDSRSKNWKPAPNALALEVSGLELIDNNRIAVAIRKGEVWFLSNVYDKEPSRVGYHRFANALHEPLGLLKDGSAFITAQRTELTRLQDTDGDDVCDDYQTLTNGWGVTGNYHEYAFGPKRDRDGNLWLTLNLGLGLKGDQLDRAFRNERWKVSQAAWRGWGMRYTTEGKLEPMAAGMRSPSGIGSNLEGDMFYTDQQGNWVATNSLQHLRRGVFYHHPEALASIELPGSPFPSTISENIPDGLLLPDAYRAFPLLSPPAVWFPYKRIGQSATDIMVDSSHGKFGPFHGQLFVGEFTQSAINRVYLEVIDGAYQGACFPFHEGFASAVMRMVQGVDGSVFVGLSNRGWSSLGPAAYGLQRLVWTGKNPFEIKEMRAQPDGFELVFTKPVDASATRVANYTMTSHTYTYHETYGSDEMQVKELDIRSAEVSDDGLRVRLRMDALRPYFVHCLELDNITSQDGEPVLHPAAYYTLNHIPLQDR